MKRKTKFIENPESCSPPLLTAEKQHRRTLVKIWTHKYRFSGMMNPWQTIYALTRSEQRDEGKGRETSASGFHKTNQGAGDLSVSESEPTNGAEGFRLSKFFFLLALARKEQVFILEYAWSRFLYVCSAASAASPALINTLFDLHTHMWRLCATHFSFGTSDFLDHYISCLVTGRRTKMFWQIHHPHTTKHLSFWLFFCKMKTSEMSTIWDCRF